MLTLNQAIELADRISDRTGELRYVVYEDDLSLSGPYHVCGYFDLCTFYDGRTVLYCAEPSVQSMERGTCEFPLREE